MYLCRQHVDCGLGIDPSAAAGGAIICVNLHWLVWAWDLCNKEVLPTTTTATTTASSQQIYRNVFRPSPTLSASSVQALGLSSPRHTNNLGA